MVRSTERRQPGIAATNKYVPNVKKVVEAPKPSIGSKLNEYKSSAAPVSQDIIDDKLSKLQGLLKMAKQ